MTSQFLRERQVRETFAPVSRATLWRWVKLGIFPPPYKLCSLGGGAGAVAWKVAELEEWANQRELANSVR